MREPESVPFGFNFREDPFNNQAGSDGEHSFAAAQENCCLARTAECESCRLKMEVDRLCLTMRNLGVDFKGCGLIMTNNGTNKINSSS